MVKILTSIFDSSCLDTVEGKKKRSPSDRALSKEPGICVIISAGNMLGSCMVSQIRDKYDRRLGCSMAMFGENCHDPY